MAGVVHLSLRLRGVWVVVLRQDRRDPPESALSDRGDRGPESSKTDPTTSFSEETSSPQSHHASNFFSLNDALKKSKPASLGTIGSIPEKTAEFNRRHGPIAVARVLAARLP